MVINPSLACKLIVTTGNMLTAKSAKNAKRSSKFLCELCVLVWENLDINNELVRTDTNSNQIKRHGPTVKHVSFADIYLL